MRSGPMWMIADLPMTLIADAYLGKQGNNADAWSADAARAALGARQVFRPRYSAVAAAGCVPVSQIGVLT